MPLSDGQSLALSQLRRIAAVESSALRIDHIEEKGSREDSLEVDVSIDCSHYERAPGGLDLHARESVRLWIPASFPYELPSIRTAHTRFMGFPHVQWGCQLCLYQSVETQWRPSRGMVGFVEQLDEWLRRAAKNELDVPEGPLHPPVAYREAGTTICVQVDTPSRDQWPWFGAALLDQRKPGLLEVSSWADVTTLSRDRAFAPTVLLNFEFPFEYPRTVRTLLGYMEARGIETTRVLVHLMLAAQRLAGDQALYVVIGAPSRGIAGDLGTRRQHLQVWEIEAVDAAKLRLVALACDVMNRFSGSETSPELRELINAVFDDLFRWQREARVRWCSVMENRPEIVTRRDQGTHMDWFKDKRVSLWGCGALGGLVAEHLVRAGVGALRLYDHDKVTPGVLVRQNFVATDVNDGKAEALRRRLTAINPDVIISVHAENVVRQTLGDQRWQVDTDIIVDATASLRVRSKLEEILKSQPRQVPIAALMISGAARHGALALCPVSYAGGPLDVFRRLGLAAMNRTWLADWAAAFWGDGQAEPVRQPEPGCSDPTFVGSYVDVAGLAARMLNRVAATLRADCAEAVGYLLAQDVTEKPDHLLHFRSPVVVDGDGLQFRLSVDAWRDIRAWIKAGARERSQEFETGGLLFGQLDETLGIAWISNASGPPEDSSFSAEGFVCGTVGTDVLNAEYAKRSGRVVQYVGTWHTHPVSAALPSTTDFAGIGSIFAAEPAEGVHQLMMIVGYVARAEQEIGLFAFEREQFRNRAGRVDVAMSVRGGRISAPPNTALKKSVGLALSGGGSRAVAFHLGTIRALADLELLDDVTVISGVSGGSLIAGMLGYSHRKLAEVDASVVEFLKRGLVWPSLRKLLHPRRAVLLFAAFLSAVLPALLLGVMRTLMLRLISFFPGNSRVRAFIAGLSWPVPRWYSRAHVMADAIADVVGHQMCNAATRGGKSIVFNACELRTGTAFRMSNERFGSWRFGSAPAAGLRVADAIAASAAYPPFLPAFDWTMNFGGAHEKARVMVTDGGVYENLGVSALEPGRDQAFDIAHYEPDIIVASDAGAGQFSGTSLPSLWMARMVQAFNAVMRKVQDATKRRLHQHATEGHLHGFLYVHLGQLDQRVALKPPDWIAREAVVDYPTDFSSMSERSVRQISGRGEALTRALATQYLLSD